MNEKQPNPSGRTFTISVKPALAKIQQLEIINQLKGVATVWSITHDKDINEQGEIVEPHTHFLIDYRTPRRISTIANIFKVDNNFVELVRNKHGMLRYLTHLDDEEKYQYDPNEVLTNDKLTYNEVVLSGELTNRDIVNYLKQGKGLELIDIVSPHRLRSIQSFLHFDNSNAMINEIRDLRDHIIEIKDSIQAIDNIAKSFINGLEHSAKELTAGMHAIAYQLKEVSKIQLPKSNRPKKYIR